MQINPEHLARLRGSSMRPEAVATIFEMMARSVAELGAVASQVTLDYLKPGDVIQEGDLSPVIILALRPLQVPNAGSNLDVHNGPTEN